jgi:hypothetical protein
MQEYRKITADGAKAARRHLLGSGAHDHPISFVHGTIEQGIANCAADEINLHPRIVP